MQTSDPDGSRTDPPTGRRPNEGSGPAGPRTDWLDETEQDVWRRLVRVEARLLERLDSDLRVAHDLSIGEYAVLVNISEVGPDGLRMSDLAERLVLSRSGLTRRVDAMERRGLVVRRACPADGRGAMATLTPAGRRRLEEAAPTHVQGVRRYLIDALGDLSGLSLGLDLVQRALDTR